MALAVIFTDLQIDAAANALREYEMAGRSVPRTPWLTMCDEDKNAWREMALRALEAAFSKDANPVATCEDFRIPTMESMFGKQTWGKK